MAEKRKTFSITFNKGIDKASLPFEASPARALDALNYVYRDGKVQKRFGINQLTQAPATVYGGPVRRVNTTEINGIWRFLAEDGQYHIVAHVGNLLYELVQNDGVWEFDVFYYKIAIPVGGSTGIPFCHTLENIKSVAVIGNKSLYVFGGRNLIRVRFKPGGAKSAVLVSEDEDTYVPTTSISITYDNAIASGRASLDQVNLMTPWRKNRLLSGVGLNKDAKVVYEDKTYGYVYHLDSPIVEQMNVAEIESARVKISRRKF